MIDFIIEFAHNTWALTAEMALYLIFGFGVAGLLYILIGKNFIERYLGKPGISSVIKASVLGVPMPLCSCSVIPVAAGLRKSGASRGATASFLSSTPQTGVDSIFATYALLGGMFTAVRVGVAFICGIVTGYLIELFCPEEKASMSNKTIDLKGLQMTTPTPAAASSFQNFTVADKAPSPESCCASEAPKRSFKEALNYGAVTLPSDLTTALIFGIILAGLITTVMPADFFSGALSGGFLAFLVATAISLPLYVCATASIPLAFAFMAAGLSPGATLVFLITGPATNTTTIVTIWKMLGRKATGIYLLSLLVVSWLAGWLFNAALGRELLSNGHTHHAENTELAMWQHACGIALIALLLYAAWKVRQKPKSCCT